MCLCNYIKIDGSHLRQGAGASYLRPSLPKVIFSAVKQRRENEEKSVVNNLVKCTAKQN